MRMITRTLLVGGRLAGGASNLLHNLAASTLTLAELREGVRQSWQGFNDREEDVESGLMPWEADFVERFIAPGSAVLMIGCGSGRDLVPLVERGCRVTGIDPADAVLEIARRVLDRRHLSATLIDGFIEDARLDGQFDTVLFSYFSYSYIPESARRVRILRDLARHLKPGGRVIVTYERMPRPRPLITMFARMVGSIVRSDWRIEDGDYLTRKRRDNREYYSFLHAFLPEDIECESAAAGFRIVNRRDHEREAVFVLEAV